MNRSCCKPWPHSAGILARLQVLKARALTSGRGRQAKGPLWLGSPALAVSILHGPALNLTLEEGHFVAASHIPAAAAPPAVGEKLCYLQYLCEPGTTLRTHFGHRWPDLEPNLKYIS
jgi:hypothetical protein